MKDGSVPGSYMKSPHNHSQWLALRLAKQESHKNSRKETSSKSAGTDVCSEAPPAKKRRLALNTTLANILICKHGMAKDKADALFAEAEKEVAASSK